MGLKLIGLFLMILVVSHGSALETMKNPSFLGILLEDEGDYEGFDNQTSQIQVEAILEADET